MTLNGPARLAAPVRDASQRLLNAALALRIASDLGDAQEARRAAYQALTALDELQPSAGVTRNVTPTPAPTHETPTSTGIQTQLPLACESNERNQ